MLPTANPKQGKRPKKEPRPLKRSRIKRGKVRFHDHGAYACNCHQDPAEVARWAEEQADYRRRNPTDAEAAVASILHNYGIKHEREVIWTNGDHPIFSDFLLPRHRITLETDGPQHKDDVEYDRRRADWLARKHKVGTVRFTNQEVRSGACEARLRQMLGIV